MALLVDPPPRDNAGERPSAEVPSAAPDEAATAPAAPVITEPEPPEPAPAETAELSEPRLAEPPLTGGRVEALMGRLIRVLSHSPPGPSAPAVLLSALGLAGVAFNGLCATAPRPSVATPPVLLPLTSVARDLGAPHLPDLAANLIMYTSITLCCLGPGHDAVGQQPGLVAQPAQGLLDGGGRGRRAGEHHPGRIGRRRVLRRLRADRGARAQPVHVHPEHAARGANNPYTMIVGVKWQSTPSVYGPVATWTHLLAARSAARGPGSPSGC